MNLEDYKTLLKERKEYYHQLYLEAGIVDSTFAYGENPYVWFSLSDRGFSNISFYATKFTVEGDISTDRLIPAIELGKAYIKGLIWGYETNFKFAIRTEDDVAKLLYYTYFDPYSMNLYL